MNEHGICDVTTVGEFSVKLGIDRDPIGSIFVFQLKTVVKAKRIEICPKH